MVFPFILYTGRGQCSVLLLCRPAVSLPLETLGTSLDHITRQHVVIVLLLCLSVLVFICWQRRCFRNGRSVSCRQDLPKIIFYYNWCLIIHLTLTWQRHVHTPSRYVSSETFTLTASIELRVRRRKTQQMRYSYISQTDCQTGQAGKNSLNQIRTHITRTHPDSQACKRTHARIRTKARAQRHT